MQIVTNSKPSFRCFLIVLIVLLSFNPYLIIIQHIPFLNVYAGSLLQLVLIPLFLLLLSKKRLKVPPSIVRLCLLVQIIGYAFSFVVHGGIGYILVYLIILLMILLFSYIENYIGFINFFKYYNKWILLMSLGGVAIFIMGQFLGIPPLYQAPSAIIETSTISSWGIGYTNCYFPDSPLSFIRYSGFFDEPGAMGYWGIYALVINKLFINDKRVEWMLLIALFFTFSFGYFIQAFVFIFLFYGLSELKGRSVWIIIIVAATLIGIYSTKGNEDSGMYKIIFGRFEKIEQTDNGLSIDDRRDELAEMAKKTFIENPLFGVGIKEWSKMPYMSDNPYETLAKDGLFGTFYLYFPYIVLLVIALKHRKTDLLKGLFVVGLGFLHRPFHENLLAFFMLYSILYLTIRTTYNKKTNESLSINNNSCLQ